jgi:hypothetical protein
MNDKPKILNDSFQKASIITNFEKSFSKPSIVPGSNQKPSSNNNQPSNKK